MESARIRRNFDKAKMLRIQNYLDNNPLGTENVSVYHYQTRLDMLVKAYSSFQQCHHDLTTYIQIHDTEELQTNEIYCRQVKEMFMQLKQELVQHISVLSSPVHTAETQLVLVNTTGSVHQSTIRKSSEETTIPSFSGNLCDWPSFFNLFSSSVHLNSNLPDVLKFMYLRSFLKGEALSYIQHFHITSYNYSAAWNKLITRYGKQTQIIQSTVLQTTKCDVSKLKYPISTCYAPAVVKTHSTISIKPSTTSKGLNYNNNKSSNLTNTVHKNQLSNSITCIVCSGGHPVHHCSNFKKFNISFRCEFARKNNLCFNCLYNSHSVAECKITSSCKVCKLRHHTLLHTDLPPSCSISISSNSPSFTSNTSSLISQSSEQCSHIPVAKPKRSNVLHSEQIESNVDNSENLPCNEIINSKDMLDVKHEEDLLHNILVIDSSITTSLNYKTNNTYGFLENKILKNHLHTKGFQETIHRLRERIHHGVSSKQQFYSSQPQQSSSRMLTIHENKDIEVVSTCLANWKHGGIKLIINELSSENYHLVHLCFTSLRLSWSTFLYTTGLIQQLC